MAGNMPDPNTGAIHIRNYQCVDAAKAKANRKSTWSQWATWWQSKTLPRPLEIYAAVSYQITLLIMTTGMEIMEAASQAVVSESPLLQFSFFFKSRSSCRPSGGAAPSGPLHLARLNPSSRHPLHLKKLFSILEYAV